MKTYAPNSEIKIAIYKPKYVIGDIVYIPNRKNKYGIYLKITSFSIRFSEFSMINGIVETPYIIDSGYIGQIMLGSNYDTKQIPFAHALVGYLTIDILDVDTRAEFVAHKKDDYILFHNKAGMAVIDEIIENLQKQAIETNALNWLRKLLKN